MTAPAAPAPSAVPSPILGVDLGGSLGVKDAAHRLTEALFGVLVRTWRTTSADVEVPTTVPRLLSCVVNGGPVVASRSVGPAGGTLHFGTSELRIPAGALAADVQITATLTRHAGVHVEFAPHGLRFAKPAELNVDYAGCAAPAGAALNVYYTDDEGRITQTMPSTAAAGSPTIRALTDHFSGFTVGWGRSRYSDVD